MGIRKSISLYVSNTGHKGVISLSEVKIGENNSFEALWQNMIRR
jgi:hypothetical protein